MDLKSKVGDEVWREFQAMKDKEVARLTTRERKRGVVEGYTTAYETLVDCFGHGFAPKEALKHMQRHMELLEAWQNEDS